MENAIFISPRPLVTASNNYLLKEISCHPQWTQLLPFSYTVLEFTR